MDLGLTPEQDLLKAAVADFVTRELDTGRLLRLDEDADERRAVWDQIGELGWLGIAIPERYGGSFSSHLDVAVLFEELGRGPVPGPYFSSAVLSAFMVEAAGSEAQRAEWLPRIGAGDVVLTLALADPQRSWGATAVQAPAQRRGDQVQFSGLKSFVHDATDATHFLVAARAGDGVSLLLIEAEQPGVAGRDLRGFMGGVGEVRFENAEAVAVLGAPGQSWATLQQAIDRALPILCAYQVGSMQRMFEMSVAYSGTRKQFGQPIGRFQRVQDHIVHLVNHLDSARWTTYEALWKLDRDRDLGGAAHLAKSITAEAHVAAANFAHEVHAGMGIVTQYGLTRHTRASRTLYQYLGDPAYHKRELARALGFGAA